MYNTNFPAKADLPTTERLLRSTGIAAAAAAVILTTLVLPAEYGFDLTGVGRLTGLKTMGDIKMQLAEEAAANEALSAAVASGGSGSAVPQAMPSPSNEATQELASRVDALEALIQNLLVTGQTSELPPVPFAEPAPVVASAPLAEVVVPEVGTSIWRDEISFTLTPGQGTEYKLVMDAGAVAAFEFFVDGGVINFDQHGEGEGQSLSYEEGRGVMNASGQIVPPVSGTHGWFFRNRGETDVVVTLRTGGDYGELRKLI